MHQWNLDNGATMTMAGLWHRPWYFARAGEGISEAYVREATEFLNRVYTNPFAKLAIGKARYGIMLRDDGIVMDDGTTWRLGEDDYFMTTTTAHAGPVIYRCGLRASAFPVSGRSKPTCRPTTARR